MMKNELVIVESQYLPEVKKEDIQETYKISKSLLPQLGLVTSGNEKGLYKCVFPNGVSGTLAKAKDGSGNLGTIMNSEGIAGQARWIEQSVNPTMMFAAAALHNIEERLEEIAQITKDMFEFEQVKEEAQLLADVSFLTQTFRDYQFNVGNQLWMTSKTSEITACQNRSFKYIDEYKKLSLKATEDKGIIDRIAHTDDKANAKVEDTIKYLENYQKGVFLFAFSEYVHVLTTESFDEQYLTNIQNDIERLSSEYRDVFGKVSLELENYSKGSLDLKALELAGEAAKSLGQLADKTPLIKKTKTAGKLISGGESLKSHKEDSVDAKIKNLSKYQKAPSHQFVENLKDINDMHHKQIEMYYDDDYVYFTEPENEEAKYA